MLTNGGPTPPFIPNLEPPPPPPAVCPDLAARGRVRESWCRDRNEEPRGAAPKGLNVVQSLKVHYPLNY